MARKPIFILLDLGTPTSPLVATFTSYKAACARQAELQAANPATAHQFTVDESVPQDA